MKNIGFVVVYAYLYRIAFPLVRNTACHQCYNSTCTNNQSERPKQSWDFTSRKIIWGKRGSLSISSNYFWYLLLVCDYYYYTIYKQINFYSARMLQSTQFAMNVVVWFCGKWLSFCRNYHAKLLVQLIGPSECSWISTEQTAVHQMLKFQVKIEHDWRDQETF